MSEQVEQAEEQVEQAEEQAKDLEIKVLREALRMACTLIARFNDGCPTDDRAPSKGTGCDRCWRSWLMDRAEENTADCEKEQG